LVGVGPSTMAFVARIASSGGALPSSRLPVTVSVTGHSVRKSKSTLAQKVFVVKGCTSCSGPGARGGVDQTADFRRAVHNFSVPIQKLLPLSSNLYGAGGVNGFAGGTVTGQEAGGTDFCWPVTVKAMSEINMTSRKTLIADSSLFN